MELGSSLGSGGPFGWVRGWGKTLGVLADALLCGVLAGQQGSFFGGGCQALQGLDFSAQKGQAGVPPGRGADGRGVWSRGGAGRGSGPPHRARAVLARTKHAALIFRHRFPPGGARESRRPRHMDAQPCYLAKWFLAKGSEAGARSLSRRNITMRCPISGDWT